MKCALTATGRKFFFGSLLTVLLGVGGVAQAQDVSADFLSQYAATYRFRLGQPSGIKIVDKGKSILFLRSGARSFKRALYHYDVATKKETVLLTAEQLLSGKKEELSHEEKSRRERMRLAARGIVSYQLSRDEKQILTPLSGKLYLFERATRNIRQLKIGDGYAIDARFSPDGRFIAFVKAADLYVLTIKSGDIQRLTTRTRPTLSNGLAEFVAQEEMGRHHGYWWAPDSKSIVFQETDNKAVETLGIIDPAQPHKAARNTYYPRAGKKNATVRLGVVNVLAKKGSKKVRWLKWDAVRYPYLISVKWRKGAPLTVVVQNRRQTESAILAAQVGTGQTERLWLEEDRAWINIDQHVPRWLKKGKGFLWTSERSGARQLELHDHAGKLVRQLTHFPEGIRSLVHVDEKAGTVVVSGAPDPTRWHLYRVSLKDGKATPLTQGSGHHQGSFSSRAAIFVDNVESVTGERQWKIRGAKGQTLGLLQSVGEKPAFLPRLQLTEVQAGKFSYHASIVRPRDFDAAKKYPVIVYVYGGPGHQVVSTRLYRYLLQQWFADHGFIVVSLDGRGTPGRGRAWERAIKGDFARIPGADQVAGLKALGKRFAELDLSRVGVHGWSFGGYLSTMLLLQYPDVYRAAVAGAPVTDWQDYDTHYTERYLGLPSENPPGYERSSALPLAKKLRRPLLIVHGTSDDNVYFSHAVKLSDALFREGKKHEFLPLSRYTHMVTDPVIMAQLYGRILNFFKENLK